MTTNLTNKKVAAQLNALTSKMHNVEVSCNYQNNLTLFGKVENVQKVVKELCANGLTALQNDIPSNDNPYFDGHMTAVVGRV